MDEILGTEPRDGKEIEQPPAKLDILDAGRARDVHF